jgi:hypothetical protein
MDVVRQTLSVLLVFALLGLALWKLRTPGNATAGAGWWNRASVVPRSLERVERLALTPQHELHLVRMDGRALVVATHPQGCEVLVGSPETVERAQP